MRSVLSLLTAAVFVLHSSLALADSVQVLSVKGQVMGRVEGEAAAPLRQGAVIGSRWMVITGPDSNAVLRFDDGQLVALQSKTTFRIDSYQYEQGSPSGGRMWLSLLAGGLRAVTGLVVTSNRSAFSLRTATATIGVRGTEWMTVIFQGVYTQVVKGLVSVSTVEGTEIGAAGQTVFADLATLRPVILDPAQFPQGLFLELRGMSLAAAAAPVTAGGPAAGAGPAVGGGLSGPATAAIIFGAVGAAALAIGAGNGDDTAATTTHH